jgi:bifunctional UDP-N-acetylglucosamine pyrophosphorylase / glucosamine-1-phosphate N-acetyltransferase
MSSLALILAAGEGTRMRSSIPKVMHPVGGEPMLAHVLRAVREAACTDIAVVAAPHHTAVASLVQTHPSTYPSTQLYFQKERLGTAHAVLRAREALAKTPDTILIAYGDTPLVTPATFQKLRDRLENGADVVVLGFEAPDPTGYGRLLIENDTVIAVREHKDASEDERRITACNAGIMGLKGTHALALLEAIGCANAQNEYYLTDIVEIARLRGFRVEAEFADLTEVQGVNDRVQLAEVEHTFQQRCREKAMRSGVTLLDPSTVYFSADTILENDVVVEPNVFFGAGVHVGKNAVIHAFSHLAGVTVGEGAHIGPFARIRPKSEIGANAKVGNFVEVKNSIFADGVKAGHLSYLGDSNIGQNTNIGAGTITCNYDGTHKARTTLGSNVFVGSNSALVAPISVGDNTYIAAGSTITESLPSNALGIARARQVIKTDWKTP